ncbi:OLC1v1009056C1 [Oldenlandia corymbosa var. corymbosa]|uniref:OLC1v1009056C1 n=1 Tax=Oldenlandia corymbosa var. corymbosa TaxID=529605 RepID=A0AAV1DMZ1_OLDCO|nr:OLC1v1009056C1 [Oldenlandia corymbosa var. corymbosa]
MDHPTSTRTSSNQNSHGKSTPNPKSQESTNKQEVVISTLVDRISDLPDEILVHILSYVGTKDAVATGVLSKRWKLVWIEVPCLYFNDGHRTHWSTAGSGFPKAGDMNFVQFVDKVLLQHNNVVSSIQKLKIIGNWYTWYDVEGWIRKAINLNVVELDLSFPGYVMKKLSEEFFSCKSLVVLKLYAAARISVPSTARLPNLRILHLVFVRYQDNKSASRLISCCLGLEELKVSWRDDENLSNLRMHSPTLKNLRLEPPSYRIRGGEPVLDINAPALQNLEIIAGSLYHSLLVTGMEHFLSLPHFLECFEKLEVLRLEKCYEYHQWGDSSPTYVEKRLWTDPALVPEYLKSSLRIMCTNDFRESESELCMLKYILKHGNVLQTVEIHPNVTSDRHRGRYYSAGRKAHEEVEEKRLDLEHIIKNFQKGSQTCEIK